MANIDTLLQEIMDAVYGEEVRGSIHDALAAMNQESSSAMQYAATAQDSAQASATSASTSASTATQKASDAASSATAAAGSALTATQKASDAAGSASTATQKATAASNSATSASTSATTATQKASDAASSATSAAASATNAANSATTAQQFSGNPPKPQNGTWWIWDVEHTPHAYVDTGISCELVGPQGVGITNIQHTSGNHSPGTSDVYTITLTNGNTYTISVWNGRNGEGAGDILGISFEFSIPTSSWNNGSAIISDSRFVALSKYRYFVMALESSRDEFLECKVSVEDITTTGSMTFTCETTPTHALSVNVTRMELASNS